MRRENGREERAAGIVPMLRTRGADHAIDLARRIAVHERRSEAVLEHVPAPGEDHEVGDGAPVIVERRGEDREDGRIGVIELDRPHGAEPGQIVREGNVRAVPRDHVERRMGLRRFEQVAPHLGHELKAGRAGPVFVRRGRREEVAGVGESVRAHEPAFGKAEPWTEDLEHPAASLPFGKADGELDGPRNDRNGSRRHAQPSQLGAALERPRLRDEEHIPVGARERAIGHVGF